MIDVEAVERATVAALAPRTVEVPGWLVALDPGTVNRARSAVPLRHDLGPERLDEVEAAFWAEGLRPGFRIADAEGLEPLRTALAGRGYAPGAAVVVKVGPAGDLAALGKGPAELVDAAGERWRSVFLGEGFDPVDGAHRVRLLTAAPGAVFGQIRDADETVAVGVLSLGHGWAGVHGMRTVPGARGRGYAAAILAAFGGAATERGVERVFLQVEADNPARRLYRRAGFRAAWTYRYWTSP